MLAQVLNGGYASVGPTTNAATGKPNIAAVPAAYGSLASVLLQAGAPSAEGVKTSLTLETTKPQRLDLRLRRLPITRPYTCLDGE